MAAPRTRTARPPLSIVGLTRLFGAFVASAVALGLLGAGLALPVVGAIGASANTGIEIFESLPSDLLEPTLTNPTKILAADGSTISTPQDENRIVVPLSAVSPIMRKAQVSIEDHRFYEHSGLDLQGTMRAFIQTVRSGTSAGGGSSLTQQYVKKALEANALAVGDKAAARAATAYNPLRKVKELKYALAVEQKFTKDQILEKYLNLVYYGDRAYGVQAAAQHYFSKDAKDLTLSESALLAGLVQNPSRTDPIHFPDKALARRAIVLDRMHQLGVITDAEWTEAKNRPLAADLKVSYPKSSCVSSPYPYFCDYVMAWLADLPALGATREDRLRLINQGGLTIQTTLDPKVQAVVNEEIVKMVPVGNTVNARGVDVNIGAAAFVSEPGTGKVLAFGQNTQYSLQKGPFQGATNWAVESKYGGSIGFPFGSTAKAFALVTALESGLPLDMRVDAKFASDSKQAVFTEADVPMPCGVAKGDPWKVFNDSPGGGDVDMYKATDVSMNTAFIALASRVGVCKVRDTATKMGMHQANGKPLPTYPAAIILGSSETSPETVANAYGVLASEGKRCPSLPVLSISQRGKVIYEGKPACEQVITPQVAQGTTTFLKHNMDTGSGKHVKLAGGREAGGKTGTANGNNESWFVGYTPQLSTAVWVGTPYDNNKTQMFDFTIAGKRIDAMHGASLAGPIWKGIMDRASEGMPMLTFTPPPDQILQGDLVPIPNVVGKSYEEAEQILQGAGFAATRGNDVVSKWANGKVDRQIPSGKAVAGSMITLNIANGTQPAPPPPTTPPADPNAPAPPAPPAPAPPAPAPALAPAGMPPAVNRAPGTPPGHASNR